MTSQSNIDVIDSFYRAFERRDAQGMVLYYAPAVRFSDPVFSLEGWRARAMWHMLCERALDLRIECRNIRADDTSGSAHWEAWYTFSATGHAVHNVIDAAFGFEGGLIARHEDRFDFHRWSAQALGMKGRLLGWAPPMRQAVRRQAVRSLDAYIRKSGLTEATA